ncbi:amino acid permease [Chlamydiales bacterium]|nr:amino acid permease [Chlamydiales bacterium]
MVKLKRSINLFLLICYGVGTILGAGIYVLIGKVAYFSGMATPISFLMAALIAGFTGLSYAELSSRYPKSAGEAVYVLKGWKLKWLSGVVGWMIVFTGVVSAATIANGFVGYLQIFVPIEPWVAITLLIVSLGTLAIWGISESIWVAAIITIIEVFGLLLVIWDSGWHLNTLPDRWVEFIPSSFGGVFTGTFLAFYAYIGFEDMVNLAEEVKNPRKTLPKGILWAILISTIFYVLISIIAVLAIPIEQLTTSNAPLVLLVKHENLLGIIAIFAVVNGALVQIIMASRIIYGMGSLGLVFKQFSSVHSKRQTPILATLFITLLVLLYALLFPLVVLAQITSFVILIVFALVNSSLILVKINNHSIKGSISFPLFVPVIGTILCLLLLIY